MVLPVLRCMLEGDLAFVTMWHAIASNPLVSDISEGIHNRKHDTLSFETALIVSFIRNDFSFDPLIVKSRRGTRTNGQLSGSCLLLHVQQEKNIVYSFSFVEPCARTTGGSFAPRFQPASCEKDVELACLLGFLRQPVSVIFFCRRGSLG